LAQQPLNVGINIGAKGMSPAAAQAQLTGLTGAARSQASADAYNPFASALQGFGQNPMLAQGLGRMFGGTPSANAGGYGYGGFGTGYGFGEQDLGQFL
jgi:hypothetical protein